MTAERVEQRTPSPRLFETGELPPILRDPSVPMPRKPFRPVHFGIKTVLFVFVFYFFILPLIPGFRRAAPGDRRARFEDVLPRESAHPTRLRHRD